MIQSCQYIKTGMDASTPPKTPSFAHQAAKLSWLCPVMMLLVMGFVRQASARVVIDFVALGMILVGLVFAIVALFGIRTHGTKGILVPAIGGLIINSLLLFIFVTNFFTARAKALQQRRSDVPVQVQQVINV